MHRRNLTSLTQRKDNNKIVFRDLKPENFLLSNKDPNAPLKATDFGLSVFYHPGQIFTDIVGSAYYVAPEVISLSGTASPQTARASQQNAVHAESPSFRHHAFVPKLAVSYLMALLALRGIVGVATFGCTPSGAVRLQRVLYMARSLR